MKTPDSARSNQSNPPPHLLYVDTDPEATAELTESLRQNPLPISIVTASSAESALETITAEHINCIVSEYALPGISGIEFLETVRQDHPNLPFILFTGHGSEEIASHAISADVTDYLRKETGTTNQLDKLVDCIKDALDTNQRNHVIPEPDDSHGDLERTQYRMDFALHETNSIIWEWELETDRLTRHGPVKTIFGIDNETIGETPEEFISTIHPHDQPRIRNAYEQALEGERFHITYRHQRPDGEVKWIEAEAEIIYDDDGEPERLIGLSADVTPRKRLIKELQETNQLLEAVIEATPIAVLTHNLNGIIQIWNSAAEDVFGWTADEVIGESLPIIQAGKEDEVNEIRDRVYQGESISSLVLERQTKSGDLIDIRLSVAPIRNYDGEIIGNVSVAEDITEEQEYREALRANEERFRALFEQSADPIYLHDEDGTILDVNSEACKSLGYDHEDLVGKTMWDIAADPEKEVVTADLTRLSSGQAASFDGNHVRSDGSIIPVEVRVARINLNDDTQFVATVRDMTERLEREKQLREKNKQLDEFAGLISHDLRNPLNVATGNLELARTECDAASLETVKDALNRMEQIIENTLTLTRSGRTVGETTRINLGLIATQCWVTVSTATATLQTDDLPFIEADRDRLRHLFENLYRNAIQHGGPAVTIRVGSLENGFFVEDDGPGIPSDQGQRVFEAGHSSMTTGAGLGLAIVERIVEAHGWTIAVTDGSMGGARFEIRTNL